MTLRSLVRVCTTFLVLLVVLLANPSEVWAHEITIGIVISPTSGLDSDALLDGVWKAIDESPDVGHAPGPDAGDHLGGVDVVLMVETDSTSSSESVASMTGASIIVVAGDSVAIQEAARVIGESSFLVAVAPSGDIESVGSVTLLVHAPGAESLDVGYDVGQFLDTLIGQTDGAVPTMSSVRAIREVAQERVEVTDVIALESFSTSFEVVEEAPSSPVGWWTVALSVAVGGAIRTLRRRGQVE